MKSYTFPKKEFDPRYLRAVLQREFGNILIGWCERDNEVRMDFTRELTPQEEARLKVIMDNPPRPAEVLEYCMDLSEEIASTIGKRPVYATLNRDGRHAVVMFDTPLTDAERNALENLFKAKGLRPIRGGR
jgi:hypothetical protein